MPRPRLAPRLRALRILTAFSARCGKQDSGCCHDQTRDGAIVADPPFLCRANDAQSRIAAAAIHPQRVLPPAVKQPQARAAVGPLGWRQRCSRTIHAPGLGRRCRNAGMKPIARNGIASPSPSAANTSNEPWGGSSSAVPSAAPRNGPAQGVATNAASAPVAKPPLGRARPASTGSWNSPPD